MDFLALAVLTEAVSAGSLAAAARRLHITPMAATRSLSGLERALGVRLLHRTTRSLSLTDEGQVFLAHAQALLEERDAALASVRPADAGATGRLRLTASTAFGRKVVAPALVGFMRAQPEVRVDLVLTDRVVDLVGEGLDLGIRIATLSESSLVARRLATSPRGLFATPGYLAAAGTPARAADLAAHECLALAGADHWALGPAGQQTSVRVAGRFTANTIEGLHQACLGGLGIALLSRWDVAEEVARGLLAEVRLEEGEPEPLAIWAVYPTRRMVPAKVRLFIRFLAERLEASGY
ncbi:DNA-binding transcriptional regulator, LysR family [Methylobacterium sp. 174MFSha1.1]|uniref:LysR family transcriptional regulator n=1 Tax=Methylobacterium sp. 174MFSha1.1 TaxID=1502749 RepID=UPI0008E7F5ED|nr:LysR family transcriptional regulator [Methylobacterium sp. 174MFSha1.1]SFV05407.1 DNA-binding transcriptional regulator, LysR family [Methylobacterium sp. 174MFSha1.1]